MTEAEAKAWLRRLREEQGYTQKELAEKVGKSERTILEAEKPGSSFPGGFTLLRMLQVLGALEGFPDQPESPLQSLRDEVFLGMDALARGIARIEERLDAPGDQARER